MLLCQVVIVITERRTGPSRSSVHFCACGARRLSEDLDVGRVPSDHVATMTALSILDREHSIAGEHYSRWLVPPAALAIHLSIGQAYAFSVFNLPLTKLIGITRSAPEDWSLSATIWMFNIAFFFLGASAAVFGTWVERAGPRKAMLAA